jgi:two-component system sensor histidine kinase PhoQ
VSQPYSINQRTLLTTTVALFCFLGIVGWVLDRAFNDSAEQAVQQRLESTLYGLLAVADVTNSQQLTIPNFLTDERFNRPGSGLYALITDKSNAIVWQSRSLLGVPEPDLNFIPAGKRVFSIAGPSQAFFIYSAGIAWEIDDVKTIDYTFHILTSADGFQTQVNQFRRSLWGWLAGATLILLAIQILLLRWGLTPLRQVSNDLIKVENGTTDHLPENYPIELHGLTKNLNHLLKVREQQLTRYRNALADLAHSLKTPLAVLRGLSLNNDVKNQQTIHEQTQRMNQIVDYQLQRAATAGQTGLISKTKLYPAIQRIINSLGKVYADKAINVEMEIAKQIQLVIDENDLMELMGNLLDNSFKWANHLVRVSAAKQDNSVTIEVEDDGPGIDAAQVSHVMQRGARVDIAIDGHGIGLAVCHDIVSAYQGGIKIEQGQLSGTRVVISLPN